MMFSSDTYEKRRAALKQTVKSGVILLPGNEESSINYADNCYYFRQDSNFLYYAGLSRPGLYLLLDCDSGEETLFGNDLGINEIIWMGSQPKVAELAGLAGIGRTENLDKLTEVLRTVQSRGLFLHFVAPYRNRHLIWLSDLMGWPVQSITARASTVLINAIVAQRSVKTAEEIREIDRAVRITGEMHMAVMCAARPGMKEHELAGLLHGIAVGAGGILAFPVILTRDGQTLHNHFQGHTLAEGDLVLCDAGAETQMGYCGDMTRTFPVGSTFSAIQAEVYEVVWNAHQAAIQSLEPGVRFLDIHRKACMVLFDGLKAIGLTRGDTEEAVMAGAHALFFQCGLGHMMGLDVHDMENLGEEYVGYTEPKSTQFGLKSLRLGRELQPGFVLTVEPGIYFIPELIDLWRSERKLESFINYKQLDAFRSFGGIRIEDNFAITETDGQLLGKPIPNTVKAIEAIRVNS